MRLAERLEEYRVTEGAFASRRGDLFGAFENVPGPCGLHLMIVASDGGDPPGHPGRGWQHVSVSTRRRIPNWIEMSFVKDLFWAHDECVLQYHPPRSEYVNNHPYCLHLWKPPIAVPLPPSILVGLKGVTVAHLDKSERRIKRAS